MVAYSKLQITVFCPKCKAEYRQGFAECSDCNIPLVSSFHISDEGDSKTLKTGRLEVLWEGDNLALHSSLLDELAEAGIRYFSRALNTLSGARRWDIFPIQAMTRFGYQVAVLTSDLPAAQQILETVLEEMPQDAELPEQPEVSSAGVEPPSRDAEEPTLQIWASKNPSLTDFLRDALHENQIPLRTEELGNENRFYVRPSDADRAKEIIREIVDAAPPG